MNGDLLKATRDRVGESQTKFAKRLGIDQTTLSRWEAFGIPDRGPGQKIVERVVSELGQAAE